MEFNQKTNKKLIDKIELLEQEIRQEKNLSQHSIRKLKEETKVFEVIHYRVFSYSAAMLRNTPIIPEMRITPVTRFGNVTFSRNRETQTGIRCRLQ